MLISLVCSLAFTRDSIPYFVAPAGKNVAQVIAGGRTVLPNGRLLTPAGKRLYAQENVWQTLIHGDKVVIFHENGITAYSNPQSRKPIKTSLTIKGIAPAGCFSKDGQLLYVSMGDKGSISALSTGNWKPQSELLANVNGAVGSYINDMALSADGSLLYAVDIANQDLLTWTTKDFKLASRTKAGREPYALAVDSKSNSVYIANIGLFDYSKIPATTDPAWFKSGLSKPAFEFPSKEAEFGVEREGRLVPGLGPLDAPGAQSIYEYKCDPDGTPILKRSVKTGLMIRAVQDGREIVGGSAPNALFLTKNSIFVSNANNDTVQQFDKLNLKLKRTISLSPTKNFKLLRGVIPSGLVATRDSKTLYVCESGLNSVAVIDIEQGVVKGRIPTGWFPMQIRLSDDERSLLVACQKGIGRGPRGVEGVRKVSDERYGFSEFPGMANWISIPNYKELSRMSKTVLKNNGLIATQSPKEPNPIPTQAGQASQQIEHVVFITKENHTFDGIFGELKGANGKPEYAEFGGNGWIRERNKTGRLPIMPNHIRLAEKFSISDNFYMEPQASGDGHRWLVGVYPSLWTSRVFYAGWDFRLDDRNKGRLVSFGSNGSQIPEDYLENGSIWEHLQRGNIDFRNYGEGFEFAGADESENAPRSGAYFTVNHPVTRALWNSTCWDFPIFNTSIPDIARVEWFKEDIEKNYRAKGKSLPRFMNIALCNDHGAEARPTWGYPYVCSYMADNDLALGRVVEFLSKQPEWKKMAIFVTQDDSGGDNDHVDRHRSFVLALGPWAKKNFVSHDHTSIMSIIKTIYQIFGLGPNNMFDAVATDLRDMFTMKPDFSPYTHIDSDHRVFDAKVAFLPGDKRFDDRRWLKPTVKMDDPKFIEWLHDNFENEGGGGEH